MWEGLVGPLFYIFILKIFRSHLQFQLQNQLHNAMIDRYVYIMVENSSRHSRSTSLSVCTFSAVHV